jgi:hypothetical protein
MPIVYSPVIAPITPDDVVVCAQAYGGTLEEWAVKLAEKREQDVARMKSDPLLYGYQPPIARVCQALLGLPWAERLDGEYCRAMRAHLGFERPVRSLLLLGGNRSGKTHFEAYAMMRMLLEIPGGKAWMFHMTHQNSVEYHHKLMHDLLPAGWRRKVKTETEYISWNEQMGFSSDKFVLMNRAVCSFRNYSQDPRDAIEGGEPDGVAADELIPGDWAETLEVRLATRNGFFIIGFTPVDGYTGTVAMFCDGAQVVKQRPAFLCPTDGGPELPHLALGLQEDELREVEQALIERRDPRCFPCRPQRCEDWLRGGTGDPAAPAGRKFEMVPRILKCARPDRAVVYFHSSDNPFGNPRSVIEKIARKPRAFVRERFYGIAERLLGARFATFDERVHVVRAADVPQGGTNYQIVDPCSGRAFFMVWIRAMPDGRHYVYREWPGSYHIPGVGVPEPWAEPSTGKEQDGRRGKGQKSLGWGLAGYKREIARLEGWGVKRGEGSYRKGAEGAEGEGAELWRMETPEGQTDEEWVRSWDQHGPARERVAARYMDARFGNTKSFEEGGMVTLIEQFEERVNLTFFDSSTGGGKWTVEDGCTMIEDALAFDATRPVDFFNAPRLYVSDECRNVMFALKVWTGADGGEGATKDPIDCVRMYFLKGCNYRPGEQQGGGVNGGEKGGCY